MQIMRDLCFLRVLFKRRVGSTIRQLHLMSITTGFKIFFRAGNAET